MLSVVRSLRARTSGHCYGQKELEHGNGYPSSLDRTFRIDQSCSKTLHSCGFGICLHGNLPFFSPLPLVVSLLLSQGVLYKEYLKCAPPHYDIYGSMGSYDRGHISDS